MILYIYIYIYINENTKNGTEDFHTLIRLNVILFTTSHLVYYINYALKIWYMEI